MHKIHGTWSEDYQKWLESRKPLTYPMDYEVWKKHPKTIEAMEIMKQDLKEKGQLELF